MQLPKYKLIYQSLKIEKMDDLFDLLGLATYSNSESTVPRMLQYLMHYGLDQG